MHLRVIMVPHLHVPDGDDGTSYLHVPEGEGTSPP
jgi:hypothetical protein